MCIVIGCNGDKCYKTINHTLWEQISDFKKNAYTTYINSNQLSNTMIWVTVRNPGCENREKSYDLKCHPHPLQIFGMGNICHPAQVLRDIFETKAEQKKHY